MKITSFRINYGISFEEGGIWHKPEFGLDIELGPKENPQIAIKKAWIIVKDELQKQLDDK